MMTAEATEKVISKSFYKFCCLTARQGPLKAKVERISMKIAKGICSAPGLLPVNFEGLPPNTRGTRVLLSTVVEEPLFLWPMKWLNLCCQNIQPKAESNHGKFQPNPLMSGKAVTSL